VGWNVGGDDRFYDDCLGQSKQKLLIDIVVRRSLLFSAQAICFGHFRVARIEFSKLIICLP